MRSKSGSTLAALGRAAAQQRRLRRGITSYSPVTDARLTNPEPRNWLMTKGRYQGWSYSDLDQINTDQCQEPGPGLEHVDRRRFRARGAADRQ